MLINPGLDLHLFNQCTLQLILVSERFCGRNAVAVLKF